MGDPEDRAKGCFLSDPRVGCLGQPPPTPRTPTFATTGEPCTSVARPAVVKPVSFDDFVRVGAQLELCWTVLERAPGRAFV